jgi:soluble lytic murein transglycosylase-like protein
LALSSLLFFATTPLRAEIWGYVDARGVAHLAAEKLDDRYELFSRGRPSFSVGELAGESRAESKSQAPAEASPQPEVAPPLPPQLVKFFETSAGYRQAQPLLRDASRSQGVDYELLKALIVAESGFDPKAVSPKGAIGLMQVMPATAERWGVRGDAKLSIEKKLADPQLNVRTGTRYLRHLIGLFPDRLDLALAAYNAGEGAVQRAGNRIPNYRETQNYVKTVMHLYAMLKPPAPVRAAPAAAAAPAPAPARRVRMELPGQVPGRANMPPPLTSPSATPND